MALEDCSLLRFVSITWRPVIPSTLRFSSRIYRRFRWPRYLRALLAPPTPATSNLPTHLNISNDEPLDGQHVASEVVVAPIGALAALAGSASVAASVVRAGAALRLVTCGGGGDDLTALAGSYLGVHCLVCLGTLCVLLWKLAKTREEFGISTTTPFLPSPLRTVALC